MLGSLTLALATTFPSAPSPAAPPSPSPEASHAAPSDDAEQLAEKIAIVPSERRRDELFDELLALAKDDAGTQKLLRDLLVDLWRHDHVALNKTSHTRAFRDLAEARKELDELRSHALELIRDERKYPYPHVQGEAPITNTKLHEASQKAIDARVARMRQLWDDTEPVTISKSVRRSGERMLWTRRAARRAHRELGLEVLLPRQPGEAFFHGLPYEKKSGQVTLADFALGYAEGVEAAVDRAVLEGNRAHFAELAREAKTTAERQRVLLEQRQVELTNEYRRLFGLPVLGHDPRLYAAARHHAEYLDRTGTIGHMQPDAEMATYQMRSAAFGYADARYENATKLAKTPERAHHALTHSSAHHRAILQPRVSEMSTGLSGDTWVQLYGLDTEFRSRIQCPAWRD